MLSMKGLVGVKEVLRGPKESQADSDPGPGPFSPDLQYSAVLGPFVFSTPQPNKIASSFLRPQGGLTTWPFKANTDAELPKSRSWGSWEPLWEGGAH